MNGVTFWTAPGAPTEKLQAFVTWFDAAIEPVSLGNGDDWSWAEPALVPPSNVSYSNHGSGTAIDLNLERHAGQGASGTFTPEQASAIAAKAAELGLVWGGSWTDIPDEPHIELAHL
ncbi:M15 family metallopeptidase (plasmid) [Gordonia sp. LUNF6]|uniref:M15 family metallopeptidase n=1 Tax=Gordonia TaxID=2053 RepID=UPI0003486E15|nr:M15 family metallopeptidase [Gordonia sihwensis]WFN95175.1 M15 family metallopeptidase [Gordonia sihwensis]